MNIRTFYRIQQRQNTKNKNKMTAYLIKSIERIMKAKKKNTPYNHNNAGSRSSTSTNIIQSSRKNCYSEDTILTQKVQKTVTFVYYITQSIILKAYLIWKQENTPSDENYLNPINCMQLSFHTNQSNYYPITYVLP